MVHLWSGDPTAKEKTRVLCRSTPLFTCRCSCQEEAKSRVYLTWRSFKDCPNNVVPVEDRQGRPQVHGETRGWRLTRHSPCPGRVAVVSPHHPCERSSFVLIKPARRSQGKEGEGGSTRKESVTVHHTRLYSLLVCRDRPLDMGDVLILTPARSRARLSK